MTTPHKTKRGKYREFLTERGQILLEGWARDGLTDAQIAKNAGIALGTLYEWKKNYPEIDEAIKKGKEVVDYEVENALRNRALGYTYEERREIQEVIGGELKKRIEITQRHVPADTAAAIFWLRNRRSDRWSNVEPSTRRKQVAEAKLAEERLKELSAEKVPIMIELVELERPDNQPKDTE